MPFSGNYNPGEFIEWVQHTEHVLRHLGYEEHEKVKVMMLHFEGPARLWWNRLEKERHRLNKMPISEWHQLVYVMTRKYVPRGYKERMERSCTKLSKAQ